MKYLLIGFSFAFLSGCTTVAGALHGMGDGLTQNRNDKNYNCYSEYEAITDNKRLPAK